MSYLLIGSSNIYRFHKLVAKNDQKYYSLTCCTNVEVWNNIIDDIKAEKGEVIVSIIENLICDAVVEVTDPEARKLITIDVIGSFLEQVRKCAEEHPGVKFALVQLMQRPKHQWYMDNDTDMCRIYGGIIKSMNLRNVAKIEGSPTVSQVFGSDGVHLTESAGKVLVETIITNAEAFFKQEIIDLEVGMDTGVVSEPSKSKTADGSDQSIEKISGIITAVEMEVGRINEDTKNRRLQDSMVTARIREELDFISNTSKEDRLVISGLSSKSPKPAGLDEGRKWVKNIVGEFLNSIEPESAAHIVFANQGNNKSRDIPIAEVKMDSKELALRIRKQFAAKKKLGVNLGKAFVTNSVSLATRVRVDILRAIAKQQSSDREDYFVSAFTSRPVMHVKQKEGGQRFMTYNFSDAIAKFGGGLREEDLGEAYRRAGRSFTGQLQQNFVVLHDAPCGSAPGSGKAWNPSGGSGNAQRKRALERGGREPGGKSFGTPKKQAKKN